MKKNTSGMTIVELMIFIAIFSVILIVLMQIYTSIVDKQIEVQSFSSVETDRIYIVSRLTYDIQRATNITTPLNIGSTATSLALTIGGQTYTYGKSGNFMTLTTPSGTENMNSFRSIIQNLIFRRLGNVNGKNSINVSFTIKGTLVDVPNPEINTIDTSITTH